MSANRSVPRVLSYGVWLISAMRVHAFEHQHPLITSTSFMEHLLRVGDQIMQHSPKDIMEVL